MIQVIIDIGNTLVKISAYCNSECLKSDRSTELSVSFFEDFLKEVPEKSKAILSSVRNLDAKILQVLNEKLCLMELNSKTLIPISNHYSTPETLGSDRLAAVIGAAFLFQKANVLVIDAGSCITWDFIDQNKNYLGGGIAPGFQMRLQAIHNFTAKLPLIKSEFASDLLGKSTEEAIKAGCVNAVVLEMDAVIDKFKERYLDLKVILCGGDAGLIQKEIKNNTFVHPDLVQIGLKEILDFNEDK